LKKRQRTATELRLAVLVLLVIYFSLASPYFLATDNLFNVIVSAAVVGIVANAMTLLIVAGLVDVSVGSAVGLSATAFAVTYNHGNVELAILAALVAAWVVGAVNILGIVVFRVPSIIVTLATLLTFAGVQKLVIEGRVVSVIGFDFIGHTRVSLFGTEVPFAALLFLSVTAFFYCLMRYTRYGHHMYAIGANARAARLAGIGLERNVIVAFALMGCAVTLAALTLVSQTGVVDPTTGMNLQFLALTAVMIGGASLYGGRGSVIGTVIAILMLSVLANGLVLVQVESYWQEVIEGALLLGAVLFDEMGRRSREVRMTL
jgi:ribose/xylose/arabinose/galactoside ABC-type transport system permease subunit